MKKFLALAVLATSATSFAASDRAIYDVMYLPKAGTSFGFTTAEYIKQKIEPKGVSDIEIKGYVLSQTLGHSFTDRFSLAADLNYANMTTEQSGSSDTDSKGISDPTVTAKFRTMDENYQWDLIGGATLGLGDHEIKSNGDENNYQGGSSLFVGTQFGAKTESLQWAVSGTIRHDMKAKTEDKSSGVDYKDDAHNTLALRADLLNKLAEKSLLRSHFDANFAEGYDDDDQGTTAAATTYVLGTEYQHICSANLLLRAGVDYAMVNVNSGFIDNVNQWNFRLGANYQF